VSSFGTAPCRSGVATVDGVFEKVKTATRSTLTTAPSGEPSRSPEPPGANPSRRPSRKYASQRTLGEGIRDGEKEYLCTRCQNSSRFRCVVEAPVMRVLVCGSRTWADEAAIQRALEGLAPGPTTIIHGDAQGMSPRGCPWPDHLAGPLRSRAPARGSGRSGPRSPRARRARPFGPPKTQGINSRISEATIERHGSMSLSH
jgi:hypothetical protein